MPVVTPHRREFDEVKALAYSLAGIELSDGRLDALIEKMSRRAAAVPGGSLADYLAQVTRGVATERQAFINLITVNKTDFFREPHHFAYLRRVVVARALARAKAGGPRQLRIWSSACSTGEEPYSIAMSLADLLPAAAGWDVKVLATDIDTDVLAFAERGRYARERGAGVPLGARRFLEPERESVVVTPEIRERVEFRPLNLLGTWPELPRFDVIFCRNVVIYFDRETQCRLFARLAQAMADDGLLFVGHSESLLGICDRLEPIGPTIHRLVPPGTRRTAAIPRLSTRMIPVVASPAPGAEPRTAPRSPPGSAPRSHRAPPHHELSPGSMAASAEPAIISAHVHASVAVCLFDPIAGVGGVNQFRLPRTDIPATSVRLGIHAMELLVNELMRLGAVRDRLVAKVFGHDPGGHTETFARAFLHTEGIPVAHARIGGALPLELHFLTSTGRALVRALPRTIDSEPAPPSAPPFAPRAGDGDVEVWS